VSTNDGPGVPPEQSPERTSVFRADFLADAEPQESPAAEPVTVDADGAFGSIGGVMGNDAESQRSSTGLVGADVVGLVLHTEAQGVVTATVNDGHYAAWWPDDPITEASENARTTPEFSRVTLTLRDGSTRQMRVDEFTGISMESLTTPDQGGSVQE
jgi:hypothetical protein